nr:hypothetical protein [Robinsoniella peoriensis]
MFFSALVQHGIAGGNHALVYTLFFCPALVFHRLFVVDIQQIHGAVTDVCKKIGSHEAGNQADNGRITLRIEGAACKTDMMVPLPCTISLRERGLKHIERRLSVN